MSVANSLFNVVADGKHSITPTDAIRTILGAGLKLSLEDDRGHILAEATSKGGERISTKGTRLDEALTKLVGELIYGDRVIERTDWSFPPMTFPLFSTAAGGWMSWIPVKNGASDNDIDALVGSMMWGVARKGREESLYAVVVRNPDDPNDVKVGCATAAPIPPVGATLMSRICYSAEEAISLMDQAADALEPKELVGVLLAPKPHDPREFSFVAPGDKSGDLIMWEIFKEGSDTIVDSFKPRKREPDDFYKTITYKFPSTGTWRIRTIVKSPDRDESILDTIVDVV